MHSAVDSKSDEHTCWWSRCSSSWAGSRSWAPRRRAAWSGRKAPTRCGWPRGTWRQSCPESSTCRGACVSCGWCPADPPVPSSTRHTERRRKKKMHHTENTFWHIYSVKLSVPWWRWGPRSQSGWWPAPETCRGQPRPSGWSAGWDRWSGLEAEIGHQLKRQKQQRCDTVNKGGGTNWHLPGRGAASGEYHSGWRWARECWPLGSYTLSVNVCPAGGWGVSSDTLRQRRLIYNRVSFQ